MVYGHTLCYLHRDSINLKLFQNNYLKWSFLLPLKMEQIGKRWVILEWKQLTGGESHPFG